MTKICEMASKRFLTFFNGIKMPIIGYGTWRVSNIQKPHFFHIEFWSNHSLRRHPCFFFLSVWILHKNLISTYFSIQAPDAEIEAALELALEAGYRWVHFIDFCFWINFLIDSLHADTSTPLRFIWMNQPLDECSKNGLMEEKWNAKIFSSQPSCQ